MKRWPDGRMEYLAARANAIRMMRAEGYSWAAISEQLNLRDGEQAREVWEQMEAHGWPDLVYPKDN